MEGPTYVTLSAQVALQKQLEVVANNVANASTAGFKADRQLFQSYVDRLNVPGGNVAFVQDRATYIDQEAGPIETTGNPTDIAIKGDGYLSVQTPQGTQYTRNGRLQVAADGTLTDASGRPVLTPGGATMQLPPGYSGLEIRADGTVIATVGNAPQNVGQIGTFRPSNPQVMRKSGDGLLVAPPMAMQPIDDGDPNSRIVQGALEGSTVKPVTEIANMSALSNAYQQLQSLLNDDNDREQKMIQTLGTPAA
ncbi:MAG: flagellar basal-body rod protein FlgF [Rhodospirillales bacterium 20-64-7]|nr:MAG: flagellar basal-body rod protein FlgF [Rhodospirillales bacterium 20-64-7]HQT75717.1 flagellar basal-body rod protein FlgF [Rhodopila sp.]